MITTEQAIATISWLTGYKHPGHPDQKVHGHGKMKPNTRSYAGLPIPKTSKRKGPKQEKTGGRLPTRTELMKHAKTVKVKKPKTKNESIAAASRRGAALIKAGGTFPKRKKYNQKKIKRAMRSNIINRNA